MDSIEQRESQLNTQIDKYYSQSKEQLAAIKFIKQVITTVQSYADFQQYKNDMLEALNDTEQTLLGTIEGMEGVVVEKRKKNNDQSRVSNSSMSINNNNNTIESNSIPSAIDINTASLGLRFNYDSYLNKEKIKISTAQPIQLRDHVQLQQQLQQKQQQDIDQTELNFDYSSNNSLEALSRFNKETMNMHIKEEKQVSTHIQMHNERIKMGDKNKPYNMTFNPDYNQENDSNTVIKKNKYNVGNINNDNNVNEKNDYSHKKIVSDIQAPAELQQQQQSSCMQEKNNEKPNELGITNDPIENSTIIKQKASRLTDLIMKINSEQEIYEIITQLFGEDILDNLMSSKVSDELIDNIEKSITEIERLREKDIAEEPNKDNNIDHHPVINSQGNINQKTQMKINDELFYETPINNYHPVPSQINSHTNNNKNTNNTHESNNYYASSKQISNTQGTKAKSFSDELLMANGLLPNYSLNANTGLNSSSIVKESGSDLKTLIKQSLKSNNQQPRIPKRCHSKQGTNPIPPGSNFVNYTSPHGNYFDSSLQKGGISKIKTLKNKRPNKAISPVREYIRSSNQLTSNSMMMHHHSKINS